MAPFLPLEILILLSYLFVCFRAEGMSACRLDKEVALQPAPSPLAPLSAQELQVWLGQQSLVRKLGSYIKNRM